MPSTIDGIPIDDHEFRDELRDAYEDLPLVDMQILQFLSVMYQPVRLPLMMDCLHGLEINDLNGAPFISDTLHPRLEKLRSQELAQPSSGKGWVCHPLLREIATRDAVAEGWFEAMAQMVQKRRGVRRQFHRQERTLYQSQAEYIREARIALYRGDLERFYRQAEDFETFFLYQADKISPSEVWGQICNNPFDAHWFCTLPPRVYEAALYNLLGSSLMELQPAKEAFELLEDDCSPGSETCTDTLLVLYIEQLLMRGDRELINEVLPNFGKDNEPFYDFAEGYRGWLSLLQGDGETAIAHYSDALTASLKKQDKRTGFFQGLCGPFYILALLQDGSSQRLSQALHYIQPIVNQGEHQFWYTYSALHDFIKIQQGDLNPKKHLINSFAANHGERHPLGTIIHALCIYWVQPQASDILVRILEPFYASAKAAGYYWLAMETADLLAKLKPEGTYDVQAQILREDSGLTPLTELVHCQETWELQLQALTSLYQTEAEITSDRRIAWFVTYYDGRCAVHPREQKVNAKGVWSKGRAVSLKRLKKTPEDFDYLTPQDLKVCKSIHYDYFRSGADQYFIPKNGILSLVGHPRVFWQDTPSIPVEVVQGQPELRVLRGEDNRLTLEFSPEPEEDEDLVIVKESPTRLKAIAITDEHRNIAEILGASLQVPAAAEERVLQAIQAVSNVVTVQSDIGGGNDNVESVPSVPTPHLHLLPAGNGLKVSLLCRPFGEVGPYYRPGVGGKTVIAELAQQGRRQTTRELAQEQALAEGAIAACPTLANYREDDGEHEWLLENPEDCLELLDELHHLGDEAIVEWPEGETLQVSHRASTENLSLKVGQQQDWFAASGELRIGDEEVLDMQRLLALLKEAPGRFVPLGDGQYLALSQTFRKRLEELRAFSSSHGKGLRFNPLASLALGELMDEVGDLKADKHWKAQVKKLKEVETLEPQLPSTLQAELRDYQVEGFEWLARLAHWGVGACLADDMGLGKTLQALSLILTRAPEGPTLVVAPTSVCGNWMIEAEKFAPTLNPILFRGGNRQQILDNLAAFDLVACTYGLLQQPDVAKMLADVPWQTVVLDEAQAIKNAATKRSKAAMQLQAGCKIITTGTPIENHLGELWNLFRFINPGLLGSMENFNQRFAIPIERFQDKAARNRLKKLIQPFILRRTKTQVLQELPSRTEITLNVELSKAEMSLYEALRRDAIANLADSDAEAGAMHLQVLAEIMKLRRLCCNAKLVVPETPLPSAKLQVFGNVLSELLANRHKALVFSQFVDHLHILRDYLEEQEISYQYLDGSTPAKQRQQRVNAFQAGEGDVFLISLKAGGTGLNLTAADYVIHMDPWWNPAVEDQASDRAHRIGQKRPVTIYRLVAQGTIEEKIVQLHEHKRDLADSLLEGTESSGKLSTDALLQLMRET